MSVMTSTKIPRHLQEDLKSGDSKRLDSEGFLELGVLVFPEGDFQL